MDIVEKVKSEEGFEADMYTCPGGYLTIGYGINLESTPIPKYIAELWLKHELERREEALLALPWYQGLNDDRRVAIQDMAYNLGFSGLMKFKRMISAIYQKNYRLAATEMLNSKYARDVPNRANRNAEIMRG